MGILLADIVFHNYVLSQNRKHFISSAELNSFICMAINKMSKERFGTFFVGILLVELKTISSDDNILRISDL